MDYFYKVLKTRINLIDDFILSDIEIRKIYELYTNNIYDSLFNNETYYLFYALYLQYIEKNYAKMMSLFQQLITRGNIKALYYTGYYYEKIEEYEEMLIYYNLAIKAGYYEIYNNIGSIYLLNEKMRNISIAKKYFKEGIKYKNTKCMINLGICYLNFDKKYDKALFLFKLAVENNNPKGYFYIADLYYKLGYYEKSIDYINLSYQNKCEYSFEDDIHNKTMFNDKLLGDKYKLLEILIIKSYL